MKAASILIIISICFGVYMGVRSPYLFDNFASEQCAEKGYFLAREKRFDEAVVFLRKAIERNPNNKQAIFSCKQLYRFHVANAPDHASIIELCSYVTDRSPGRLDVYEYLMIAYLESREVEKAYNTVQKVVRLKPDNPESYRIESVFFNYMGDHHKAARCLGDAIKIDPLNAYYYVERGSEWCACKQYQNALKTTIKP
ncbi:MAG: hypothetical protein R3F51_11800 [Cyanobacteriota/Melainabacteria group bacterium]